MRILADLLPVFLFVAVLAWADAHPPGPIGAGGGPWAEFVPAVGIGERQAPALLATASALAAVLVHFGWLRWRGRRAAPALGAALLLVALLATVAIGMSGDAFDRWRPSALYWLLGLVLWLARVALGRNLLRTLLGHQLVLPEATWQRLNAAWVGFFGMLGLLNLWVAHSVPADAWVPFKVFGDIGLVLLFVVVQAAWLGRRDAAHDAGADAPR